jgi:EmrB/QacA subfamily drug resistance transporter
MHSTTQPTDRNQVSVSPQAARRVLVALVFPTMLMPFVNAMSRVALPVIRDQFQIEADVVAWVATVFALPFTILTPVYGRLSDGLGKRGLILIGGTLFVLGTAITVFAPGLAWLMAGRAIQGLGTGGIMPMAMALISELFDPRSRGKALGAWSMTGPTTAFVAPLIAGLMIESWGWRAAMAPPLFLGVLAVVVVSRWIPAGLRAARPGFLRSFDWVGVGLLAAWTTGFLFYLSSRPITGVAPLRDWRLLAVTVVLAGLFGWWELRRRSPFVDFQLFRIRTLNLATLCASLRLFTLNGLSFLMPLYLADVRGLGPAAIGMLVMISPGAMVVMVLLGGRLSDRWGSSWPTVVGLGVQGLAAVVYYLLPGTAPLWSIVLIQIFYGLGSGFALAALHHAALSHVPEAQIGAAAGLYSMLRFFGSAIGTALGGVFLAHFLDRALPTLDAYKYAFLCFAGTGFLGALVGLRLREPSSRWVFQPVKEGR